MSARLLCLIALLPLPAIAQQTFHVDAAHTGASEGSRLNPYRTIGEAVDAVTAGRGDTILVRPGTYREQVVVPEETLLAGSENAQQTLILNGAGGAVVTLSDGARLERVTVGESEGAAVLIAPNASADVTNCVVFSADLGISVQRGAEIRSDNNTFHGNTYGIDLADEARVLSLRNNAFSENDIAVNSAGPVALNNGYNAFWQNGSAYEPPAPADTDLVRQPLFVNPAQRNFHLRAVSTLRDAGDPAAAYQDRDGSRNDIGADGGPRGALDLLAPAVSFVTNPFPPTGALPLSVLFDASACSDEYGIASWEWDFDASDGVTVEGFGPTAPVVFTEPGGYLVTLTVTDNSGHESMARVAVTAGDPPVVDARAVPSAAATPVTVQYQADATGAGFLEYEWDVDGDGVIDSRQPSPRLQFDNSLDAGLYLGVVSVLDGAGELTQREVALTVSTFAPEAIQELRAGQAAQLQLSAEGNPAEGATLTLQTNAISRALTVALSGVAPEDLPIQPPAQALAALHSAPAGLRLARAAEVALPVFSEIANPDAVTVWVLDPETNTWSGTGISHVRVVPGTPSQVLFESAQLGTFAVTGDVMDVPACGCGPAPGRGNRTGDALAVLAALGVILASMAGRKHQRA